MASETSSNKQSSNNNDGVLPSSSVLPPLCLVVQDRTKLLMFETASTADRCYPPPPPGGIYQPDTELPFDDVPVNLSSVEFGKFGSLRLPPLFEPTGRFVCLAPESHNLLLVDPVFGNILVELSITDAQRIELSPKGNYIMTWSINSRVEGEGNLRIWSTENVSC